MHADSTTRSSRPWWGNCIRPNAKLSRPDQATELLRKHFIQIGSPNEIAEMLLGVGCSALFGLFWGKSGGKSNCRQVRLDRKVDDIRKSKWNDQYGSGRCPYETCRNGKRVLLGMCVPFRVRGEQMDDEENENRLRFPSQYVPFLAVECEIAFEWRAPFLPYNDRTSSSATPSGRTSSGGM